MLERTERTALQKAELEQSAATIKVLSGVTEAKVEHAALEDHNGEIVLRGALSFESLQALRTDWYQREVLASHNSKSDALLNAVKDGKHFPGVTLSMRGQRFNTKGETVTLLDPVYIVDGLQRISAIKRYMEINPGSNPPCTLGCEVFFGHDVKWEAEVFEALNARRVAVAPSIHLRNARHENRALATLYGLSTSDKNSPIFGKVTWNQRAQHGELFSALTITKSSVHLHKGCMGKAAHTTANSVSTREIPARLLQIVERIGLPTYRENIKTFFEVVDGCWGLRKLEYGQATTQCRGNFLFVLAQLFDRHEDFWDGNILTVSTAAKSKLRGFPVNDNEVRRLASAGGQASPLLYQLLLNHYNSGKRTKRLTERKIAVED